MWHATFSYPLQAVSRLAEDKGYGLSVQSFPDSLSANRRHVKIRSAATPFNPQYQEYLGKRKHKRLARNSWIAPALTAL